MTRKGKRPDARGAREDIAKSGPFRGELLDLGMADRTQIELFAAVGRTKGPFHGVIDWPYLNSRVEQSSSRLLAGEGEEAWKAACGVYGDDGKPNFGMRSAAAARIVQEIAATPGAFIWTDGQGTGWAVRLVPVSAGEPGESAGLALSWNGGGRVIDPLAREEYRRAVEQQMAELPPGSEGETRTSLQKIAERMWLYERGEQLLWAIHAAVLMQRRSVVLLPDVGLGETLWSGDRARWPDNWRGSLVDVLNSLTQLHVAMLRVGGVAWRPQLTMRSAAVASFEDLERNRKQQGLCRPVCPLWNQAQAHGHFLIQIGYGFLGLLEAFAVRDNQGVRQFNFKQNKPQGEEGKVLVEARKKGQLVPVHLPTKVFGPSEWSRLTCGHRGIIQALVREVTRVHKKGEAKRLDRAHVRVGSLVPDARGRREIVCPLLQAGGRYVGFNGNGQFEGLGYQVVGRKDKGWLARCGYVRAVQADAEWAGKKGIGRITRRFLAELEEVAELLGLTVVGLARRTESWLTLAQVREIAELSDGMKSLGQVHLRIYGPEDYLQRLRRALEERGDFSVIPGGDGPPIPPEGDALLGDGGGDLRVQLRQAGLSQEDLARHLGVSESFVSQVLNGKKQWPAVMRERAEAFLGAAIQSGGSDEVEGTEENS
jgi:hypothetical protein